MNGPDTIAPVATFTCVSWFVTLSNIQVLPAESVAIWLTSVSGDRPSEVSSGSPVLAPMFMVLTFPPILISPLPRVAMLIVATSPPTRPPPTASPTVASVMVLVGLSSQRSASAEPSPASVPS